jgi:hypothetical protein
LLPPSGFAEGWTRSGAPKTYGRENLFEKINGEAPAYLCYDFVRMSAADYAGPKGGKLDIEIFQMGTRLDAFGAFATNIGPDSPPLSVGAYGVKDGNTFLACFKGSYFIRMHASAGGEAAGQAMVAAARCIERGIPGPAAMPPELKQLPAEGMVPQSWKYFTEGAVGHGFLPRGLQASYKLGGGEVTAFVVWLKPGETVDAMQAYRKYLAGAKAAATPIEKLGDEAFTAAEPYLGHIVIARRAGRIVGVVQLEDAKPGIELARKMLRMVK